MNAVLGGRWDATSNTKARGSSAGLFANCSSVGTLRSLSPSRILFVAPSCCASIISPYISRVNIRAMYANAYTRWHRAFALYAVATRHARYPAPNWHFGAHAGGDGGWLGAGINGWRVFHVRALRSVSLSLCSNIGCDAWGSLEQA